MGVVFKATTTGKRKTASRCPPLERSTNRSAMTSWMKFLPTARRKRTSKMMKKLQVPEAVYEKLDRLLVLG